MRCLLRYFLSGPLVALLFSVAEQLLVVHKSLKDISYLEL